MNRFIVVPTGTIKNPSSETISVNRDNVIYIRLSTDSQSAQLKFVDGSVMSLPMTPEEAHELFNSSSTNFLLG